MRVNKWALVATSVLFAAMPVSAATVSVNGVIGSEWAGAIKTSIEFDAGAATGNFGSPGTSTNNVAYDVYFRSEGAFVYVGLESLASTGGLDFANLYFNTNLSGGSDLGFEVTNSRAFIPGGSGYTDVSSTGYEFATSFTSTKSVIEVAIPWSFFTTDPSSMGFPKSTTGLQLRLVQAYGYSVTGGDSVASGSVRFGELSAPSTVIPLPTAAVAGLAMMSGLGLTRRR